MRVLGLDVGSKTIGVAVSDELGWTAQGVEVIRRKSLAEDLRRLSEIVDERDVGEIVIGLPRRTDGSIGPEAEKVQEFARKVEQSLKLPVKFWDERFTTVSAERALLEGDVSRQKRRQVIDMVAASLILQAYLDGR